MSHIISRSASWITLAVLLIGHLGSNYLAVQAVQFKTINRQRLALLLHSYYGSNPSRSLPTPQELSRKERLFYNLSALRLGKGDLLGHCAFCRSHVDARAAVRQAEAHGIQWERLDGTFREEAFVLIPTRRRNISILMKEGAQTADRIKAWIAAYVFASELRDRGHFPVNPENKRESSITMDVLDKAVARVNDDFHSFLQLAKNRGWDVETDDICTGSECFLPGVDEKKSK